MEKNIDILVVQFLARKTKKVISIENYNNAIELLMNLWSDIINDTFNVDVDDTINSSMKEKP